MRWRVGATVIALGAAAIAISAIAAVGRQETFEEATRHAEVVVVGTVIKKSELAEFDEQAHEALRRNRVRVLESLKGQSADEITVITVGGRFEVQTARGTEIQSLSTAGLPQLPDEGTGVLLFLRPYGDGYVIASATHGVVPIQEDTTGSWVRVVLGDQESMAWCSQQRGEAERPVTSSADTQRASEKVPLSWLEELVAQVR